MGAYATLGVEEGCTYVEAKRAYFKKCLTYHPDKHQEKGEDEKRRLRAEFEKVTDAWNVVRSHIEEPCPS